MPDLNLPPDIPMLAAIDYFLDVTNSSLKKLSRRTYKTCANTLKKLVVSRKLSKLKLKLFTTPQAHSYNDYLSKELKMGNRNFNKQWSFMVFFSEFDQKRKIVPVT